MKLTIYIEEGDKKNCVRKTYKTRINAKNYKEVALILFDLERNGIPIKKAIKEFRSRTSDWDLALGG